MSFSYRMLFDCQELTGMAGGWWKRNHVSGSPGAKSRRVTRIEPGKRCIEKETLPGSGGNFIRSQGAE